MNGEPEQQIDLNIRGMTCDACTAHVEKALSSVDGVVGVQISGWASGRATATVAAGVADQDLTQAIKDAGYRGQVVARQSFAGRPPSPEGSRDAEYDLVVIGTGGAGMAAAIKSAELGRRACLIEAGTVGGTCVNIGCVPSKALIRTAAAYYAAGHHSFVGIRTRAEGLDWPEVMRQKDQLVAELRQNKYLDVLASYGDRIELMQGRARVQADGSVVLDDGRVCRSEKLVIAAGAQPRILPLEGMDSVSVLDSTSAMALAKQPRSLLVLGGRAVALELGQTFARFGTAVTILQRSERLIPEHEPQIAEALTDYLRAEGLTIHTGVQPTAIRQQDGSAVVMADMDGQAREFRADQVLVAVGRTPNTQELGLAEAGVELDGGGFIIVDDQLRTSNPNIYAAGDVTNRPKLVYVAAASGGIAAGNALSGEETQLDLTVLPDVIFTDPQVAAVGLTEAEAVAQGYEVQVATLPLAYVPRALAARDTRGVLKLVADRASDRLLGAHVLAAEAGEVIQTAALAIECGRRYGFTVTDLRRQLVPYLTQGEGLKLAAQTFEKDVSQLSCCAA